MKTHRVSAPLKAVSFTDDRQFLNITYEQDGKARCVQFRVLECEALVHAISRALLSLAGEGVVAARDVADFAANLSPEGLTFSLLPAGAPIQTLRFDKGQTERLRAITSSALTQWGTQAKLN